MTIVDGNNQPVSGVTVTADFTGPTSGTDSGITDSFGSVTLSTGKTKKNLSATWCFTVTAVTKAGASYDAVANTITTACE